MAAMGILGEYKGSQAREIIMTLEEYEELRKQQAAAEPDEEPTDSSHDAEDIDEDSDTDGDDEKPPAHAYINEDERRYIATDNEDE
jgi:hypothetical protein